MNSAAQKYGNDDSSYRAAGEYAGIRQLVDYFYDQMASLPEARRIFEMHPPKIEQSREKLADFLSGWLGGPRVYQEKRGEIRLPMVHRHLDIGVAERDAWLKCMQLAIAQMPWDMEFKTYLLAQLSIPAERIRAVAENAAQQEK